MTTLSPIKSRVVPVPRQEGSIYGEASRTSPSPHSFRLPQGSSKSVYSNRTQVFSKEATIYTLQSQSIVYSALS